MKEYVQFVSQISHQVLCFVEVSKIFVELVDRGISIAVHTSLICFFFFFLIRMFPKVRRNAFKRCLGGTSAFFQFFIFSLPVSIRLSE